MSYIKRYASLVKFPHTLFALPFALIAYVYALTANGIAFEWLLLVKVLICMVTARNAAMGFNRWADRDIDSLNPRTSAREIPAGKISPRAAMTFVVVNAALFILCALWINTLAFYLSPLALFVILSYSYAKRVTSWSHVILGMSLAIAPMGAYIAVTGTIAAFPALLAVMVMTWVTGFDILYSLQDAEFDRAHSLRSVPARYSPTRSKIISIIFHLVTVYTVIMIGILFPLHRLYTVGAALFIAMLAIQQIISRPSRPKRIGAWFGLVNGLSSITFAAFAIADMILYN